MRLALRLVERDRPRARQQRPGSRRAVLATAKSSSVSNRRGSGTSSLASVLFPVCRAPVSTTAGITRRLRASREDTCLDRSEGFMS